MYKESQNKQISEVFKRVDASALIEMGIVERAYAAAFKMGSNEKELDRFKRVGGVFVQAAYVGEDPDKLEERRIQSRDLIVPMKLATHPIEQNELTFEFRRTLLKPGILMPASFFEARFRLQRIGNTTEYMLGPSATNRNDAVGLGSEISAEIFNLINESVMSGPDERHVANVGQALSQPLIAQEGA